MGGLDRFASINFFMQRALKADFDGRAIHDAGRVRVQGEICRRLYLHSASDTGKRTEGN